MLSDMAEFFVRLWQTAGAALQLRPDLIAWTAAYPAGDLLIATMAVLAGGSLLAGQSVILFINRVRPGRFLFSLLFYGLIYAAGLALWALMIWLCAALFFAARPAPLTAIRIAGLSSAPLLFGFLIFIPYLGSPIEWALRSWSALILLVSLQVNFELTLGTAVLCTALGWLLVQALTRLLGHPLVALRDRLWGAATGTTFDTNEQELIETATAELRARLADWEAQGSAPAPE